MNGLKIQWGKITISTLRRDYYTTISIPINYSNANYSVSVCPVSSASGYVACAISCKNKTANEMYIRAYGIGTADTFNELNWFTIGY